MNKVIVWTRVFETSYALVFRNTNEAKVFGSHNEFIFTGCTFKRFPKTPSAEIRHFWVVSTRVTSFVEYCFLELLEWKKRKEEKENYNLKFFEIERFSSCAIVMTSLAKSGVGMHNSRFKYTYNINI